MKPKHQRLIFVSVSILFLCAAALLTLRAFQDNIVFFYTPSDIGNRPVDSSRPIRVGGLVEHIERRGDDDIAFVLTDGDGRIPVSYRGMLPALFREGQGAVVEGYLREGTFAATRVLVKHDEQYMPKEVVDALKKSGRWQEEDK